MKRHQALAIECPVLDVKCGYPITAHAIVSIEPGLMQVTCPTAR